MRQKVSIGRSAVVIGIGLLLIFSFKNYREATKILNSASSLALSEEQNSKLKLASKQVGLQCITYVLIHVIHIM